MPKNLLDLLRNSASGLVQCKEWGVCICGKDGEVTDGNCKVMKLFA